MAEIVNLRMARKAKARAEQQAEAQTNRVKFGRTKAERARALMDAERSAKLLDGARREET